MFDIDDYIIAIGSTKTAVEKKDYTFKVCQVVAVGIDELFVKQVASYTNRWYRISKNLCQKIYIKDEWDSPDYKKPHFLRDFSLGF